jgi:hypothetical protein
MTANASAPGRRVIPSGIATEDSMAGSNDACESPRVPSQRRRAPRAALNVLLLLVGCSSARPVPVDTSRAWLPFLRDGTTTAEEVLLELGIPTAQFEGERILTYRVTIRDDGKVFPVTRRLKLSWNEDPRLSAWPESAVANLVLVFDERHVLARHRLIEVR